MTIPFYLIAKFYMIKKHDGEFDYLKKCALKIATSYKDPKIAQKKVMYETNMIDEMVEAHLIGVSSKENRILFAYNGEVKLVKDGENCPPGELIKIRDHFVVFARGHYLWIEILVSAIKFIVGAGCASLIGFIIGKYFS